MAPLPQNSTARLVVQYSGPAGIHDIMFRFPDGVLPQDAIVAAQEVIQAMKVWVTDDTTFESAVWYNEGVNVSYPLAWTPIVGTNINDLGPAEIPQFVSWVGRDGDGRRVKYSLQGVPLIIDEDYRYQAADTPAVAAVLDALNDAEPKPVTIGGGEPYLNPYANIGYNAYFQRKRRTSA